MQTDPWCVKANAIIKCFFNELYSAYRSDDKDKVIKLLEHAREVNYTRLGYGQGDNGHGNTYYGLVSKFSPLYSLVKKIGSINSSMDLPVLVPDFGKDGLSDLLTNVLNHSLNQFTLSQLSKRGISPNGVCSYWSFDTTSASWKFFENQPCYNAPKGKLLLVPKNIVHYEYLCSASQYLQKEILGRMQKERAYINDKGKFKYPSKADVATEIVKTTENWRYDFIVSYTSEYPDVLNEYHCSIPKMYACRALTDAELDEIVYYGKDHDILSA